MRVVVVASAMNPVFIDAWVDSITTHLAGVVDAFVIVAGRPGLTQQAAEATFSGLPGLHVTAHGSFQVHGTALTAGLDQAITLGATEIMLLEDDCFLAADSSVFAGYFVQAAAGAVVGSYLSNASSVMAETDDELGFDSVGKSLWPNMLFAPASMISSVGTGCVHRLVDTSEDLAYLPGGRTEPLGLDTAYEFGLKLRAAAGSLVRLNQYRMSPFSGITQLADETSPAAWPLPLVHVGGMSYFEHVKATQDLNELTSAGWEAAIALHSVLGVSMTRYQGASWCDGDRLTRCLALLQAQGLGT